MELKIQKAEFLKGLRIAQSIADRKSTMPMLANVLLRATGQNTLHIAATDLNVSVSAELQSENGAEGGLTVGAKALHDIVNNMPGDSLQFRRAENNWASLTGGKVDYKLVGMPDRDFPKIPDHVGIEFGEIDPGILREMIDRVLFSVCNDETRFHLNGVLFESDGSNARMVSTDGHRLSKVERKLDGSPALSAGIIIPKKGVVELKKVLDGAAKAGVAVKSPYIFVRGDRITLAVKLIDSQFPAYEQVIPQEHSKEVVIDRQLLLSALKRAQLMSSETRGVKFSVSENGLVISSDNPDIGEVREELEADYNGESVSIGFNPRYVIELLSQMAADQVTLEFNGELDPGLLRPFSGRDYLGVVMPMRI